MKLKRLNIHNLASIENAEIDFESEPLKSSEVFLITGKTGSGKSTLLDAICLALYAKTPRLENSSMNGKVEEKLDSKKGKKIQEVSINDERNILRRETGEGWSKLTFEGSNGVNYEATWSVERAHKKPTGNLQSKHWELKNLDSGMVLSKDKEIEAEMAKAIGLDFPQFCRTAMLAQGEFTKFLNSSDKEKSEILEKITGVNIYSKIGIKIFEKARDCETQYHQQMSVMEQVRVMTEEERNAQLAEQKRIEEEEARLVKVQQADDKRKQWLIDEEKSLKQQQQCEVNYNEAKKRIESEEFKAEEQLTKEWEQTKEARTWLSEYQRHKMTIDRQNGQLNTLAGEYKLCAGGELWRANRLKGMQQSLVQIEQSLKEEEVRKPVYDNAQAIVAQLKALKKNRDDWASNEATLKREQEGLKREQEALAAAEKAVTEATKGYDEVVKQLSDAENELKKMGLQQVREQKEKMVKQSGDLKQAQLTVKYWNNAQAKLRQDRESVADLQKKLVEKGEVVTEAMKRRDEAKQVYENSKVQLEATRLSVNELAATMRSGLKEGDTCPVCGQKVVVHLIPVEERLKSAYQLAQKVAQDSEGKLNECEANVNRLNSEVNGLKNSIEQGEKSAKLSENEVKMSGKQVKKQMEVCGIEGVESEEQLQERLVKIEEELKGLTEQLKQGNAKEKEVERVRKEERKLLAVRDKAIEGKGLAMNKMKDCENRINAIQLQQNKLKENEAETTKQVDEMMVVGGWERDWNSETMPFVEELNRRSKRYKDDQEKRLQLAKDVELMRTEIERNAAVQQDMLEKYTDWKALVVVASNGEVSNLNNRWNRLKDSLVETLQKRETAQEEQKKMDAQLNQFMTEHPSLQKERLEYLGGISEATIVAKKEQAKNQISLVDQRLGELKNSQSQYEKHKAERPEIAEGESAQMIAERMRINEEEIGKLQQQKGAIQQTFKDDDERKAQQSDMLKKIEQLQERSTKWNRLKEMFGDSQGSKFRNIAQSYILANLLKSANHYMATLSGRYKLFGQPGTFIIMLKDMYQGGVTRAASTLSGGESFLVSLSLALALSDIGQRLSVDTLFIDEGFGTLSGQSLDNAINTLRQLHTTGGRRVGIISHVENLKDQLPVQIQVDQVGTNSYSEVRVVG